MNDSDVIQRNQILMMRALAYIVAGKQEAVFSMPLMEAAAHTQEYLSAKLNKAPLPPSPVSRAEFEEMARAASGNPWPDDLVEKEPVDPPKDKL